LKTDVNVSSKSNNQKNFLVGVLKIKDANSTDQHPDSDAMVRHTSPRIRICPKMSQIHNSGLEALEWIDITGTLRFYNI